MICREFLIWQSAGRKGVSKVTFVRNHVDVVDRHFYCLSNGVSPLCLVSTMPHLRSCSIMTLVKQSIKIHCLYGQRDGLMIQGWPKLGQSLLLYIHCPLPYTHTHTHTHTQKHSHIHTHIHASIFPSPTNTHSFYHYH